MNAHLTGKTIVVTGSTQGVGRAVALQAAASGAAAILITGRDGTRGAQVVAEVTELGAKAVFVAADLSDVAAPDQIADAALEAFGRIDGLVNAAGLTTRAAVADVDHATWAVLCRVNTEAPLFLMQRAIAQMKTQSSGQTTGHMTGGAIVNILTMNLHLGAPELAAYAATKAALGLLTRNAAQAHRFDRIRINGINMGWADTPAEREMQARTLHKGDGWLAEASAAQPFGRLLLADDVARLAVFLLSDASIPMTGALIDQEQWVPGGRS